MYWCTFPYFIHPIVNFSILGRFVLTQQKQVLNLFSSPDFGPAVQRFRGNFRLSLKDFDLDEIILT